MEPIGVALGALGLAGLFTACIENFDLVIRATTFGREFDLLCTQLSLQRIRLFVWGENLGLVAGPDGIELPLNTLLDRFDIKPAVESTLNHLRLLLQDADKVAGIYATSGDEPSTDGQLVPSRGMTVLRDRFENFKERLRRNQKKKSVWKVTRWAIYDLAKFRNIVEEIESLLDSLDSITTSLNLLDRQRAMITREIESVSDAQSLRLLQDATLGDGRSVSQRLISDTASVRLTILTGSDQLLSNASESWQSFYTAVSQPVKSDFRSIPLRLKPQPGAPADTKSVSQELEPGPSGPEQQAPDDNLFSGPSQNSLVMKDLLTKFGCPVPTVDFRSGATHYGEALKGVQEDDSRKWAATSGQLVQQASDGNSLARRVFTELRTLKQARIPFISAAPLDDHLDILLASIEGPPDTPYEKGIFWVVVRLHSENSLQAPVVRFYTRVYHPNIDCSGKLCADYQDWWQDGGLLRYMLPQGEGRPNRQRQQHGWTWFSGQASARFSLGALLTALCGLLGSPDVEDPLVPEIAETYVRNHAEYQRFARLYTQKYATLGTRPSPEDVRQFMENGPAPLLGKSISTALSTIFSRDGEAKSLTGSILAPGWSRSPSDGLTKGHSRTGAGTGADSWSLHGRVSNSNLEDTKATWFTPEQEFEFQEALELQAKREAERKAKREAEREAERIMTWEARREAAREVMREARMKLGKYEGHHVVED